MLNSSEDRSIVERNIIFSNHVSIACLIIVIYLAFHNNLCYTAMYSNLFLGQLIYLNKMWSCIQL